MDEKVHRAAQIVGSEGLGDEAVGAFSARPPAGLGVAMAGDNEDGDVLAIVGAAQLAKHLPTVDTGEPDVEDHEIRVQITGRREAGSPVPPLIEMPGGLAKADLDDPLDHRGVLNYEDSLVRVFSCVHGVCTSTRSIGTNGISRRIIEVCGKCLVTKYPTRPQREASPLRGPASVVSCALLQAEIDPDQTVV